MGVLSVVMTVAFISLGAGEGAKKPQAEVRASQHLDAEADWEMSGQGRDLEGYMVWTPLCDMRKSLRSESGGSIRVLEFYSYSEINM